MLQNLFIKETKNYPLIALNGERNVLKIKKVLRPEDSVKFFSPLMNWLNEYRIIEKDNFKIASKHFNTSPVIMLLEIELKLKNRTN